MKKLLLILLCSFSTNIFADTMSDEMQSMQDRENQRRIASKQMEQQERIANEQKRIAEEQLQLLREQQEKNNKGY